MKEIQVTDSSIQTQGSNPSIQVQGTRDDGGDNPTIQVQGTQDDGGDNPRPKCKGLKMIDVFKHIKTCPMLPLHLHMKGHKGQKKTDSSRKFKKRNTFYFSSLKVGAENKLVNKNICKYFDW